MPSNTNYVCFSCRHSRRAPGMCPDCKHELHLIHYRWRIPPRHKIREWKKLHDMIFNPGRSDYMENMFKKNK